MTSSGWNSGRSLTGFPSLGMRRSAEITENLILESWKIGVLKKELIREICLLLRSQSDNVLIWQFVLILTGKEMTLYECSLYKRNDLSVTK